MKSKSGFTLVEVIIAVSVVAILSAVSVFSFTAVQRQSRDNQRAAKATLIVESLEKYYEKNGEYPSPRALTNNYPDNLTGSVPALLSLDKATLVAPRAPANTTNSLVPAIGDTDGFAYVASSTNDDTKCQTDRTGGCDVFTLSYVREDDEEIVTLQSRQQNNDYGRAPSAPTARTLTAAQVTPKINATSATLTCSAGQTAKYSFRVQQNSGAWLAWTAWQTGNTYSKDNNTDSFTYGFQVQVRCDSSSAEGLASAPSNTASIVYQAPLVAPAVPTTTIGLSGSNVVRTASAVTCAYGTPEYRIDSRSNGSGWVLGTWSTSRTTSETAQQGSWYAGRAAARCIRGTTTATSAVSGQVNYTHPISAPNRPDVTYTLNGDDTTFSAYNVTCPAGTELLFGSRWQADWGYDSGWGGGSVLNSGTWNTSSQGFAYTISFRAQCRTAYTTSGWSTENGATFVRGVTGPSGINFSIARAAANQVHLHASSSCGPGASLMYRADIHSWDYNWRYANGSLAGTGWRSAYYGGVWATNDWTWGNPFTGANGQTLNYNTGSRWNMAVDMLCRNPTTGRQSGNTGQITSGILYLP